MGRKNLKTVMSVVDNRENFLLTQRGSGGGDRDTGKNEQRP